MAHDSSCVPTNRHQEIFHTFTSTLEANRHERVAIMEQPIFFYDGNCGLCDRTVRFFMAHSDADALNFCSLQSNRAQTEFAQHNVPINMRSSYLLQNGKLYQDSNAILLALALCRSPHNWLSVFRYVPAFLRDRVYHFIARNRNRLGFSQPASCRLPNAEELQRVLS